MAWTGLHSLGAAPGHHLLRRGRSRLFQASTDLGPQARRPAAYMAALPVENTDSYARYCFIITSDLCGAIDLCVTYTSISV